MQENKLPKDLLTHLAEVISKSWGRWCHDQIQHCFRGVLICTYRWQPCLTVRNICWMWRGLRKSDDFGKPALFNLDTLGGRGGRRVSGPFPSSCAAQEPHTHTDHCWQRDLEMLTHRAKSSPRNPKNPPGNMQGGRVRWSLGMHLEQSVTYLLAELSEPCLSQTLPLRPVCPTPSSHVSLCFSFSTCPNAPYALARPSTFSLSTTLQTT